MSTSTRVYVGPFLVCTRPTIPFEQNVTVCSNKPHKHDVSESDQFCRKCGKPVKVEIVRGTTRRSFSSLIDPDEEAGGWYDSLKKKDVKNLLNHFTFVDPEYVGDIGGEVDYLVYDPNSISIDTDTTGMETWTQEQFQRLSKNPPTVAVELLKKVMGYESIDVNFGVLVMVG